VRDELLAELAEVIAHALWSAREIHFADTIRPWDQATAEEQQACLQLAREAVTSVHEFRRLDAVRIVRLAVQQQIAEAAVLALEPDEDHSQHRLISAAIQRMQTNVLRIDPASFAIGLYRHALRTERAKGGAR
jgi:hypothetical protein